MVVPLTHQSFAKQLSTLLGLIAVFVTVFGGIALWAADGAIDQKYATDADVKAVQKTVEASVSRIEETVSANTKAVGHTSSSVDGLALVVMDLQIDKLEKEIRAIEREKRQEAAAWNERDEGGLRDKQRALADLNTQREILFDRLIANRPET